MGSAAYSSYPIRPRLLRTPSQRSRCRSLAHRNALPVVRARICLSIAARKRTRIRSSVGVPWWNASASNSSGS